MSPVTAIKILDDIVGILQMLVSDYQGAAKDELRYLLDDLHNDPTLSPKERSQLTTPITDALTAIEGVKRDPRRAAELLGQLSHSLRSRVST